MTEPENRPNLVLVGAEDERQVVHLTCCNPNRSLCRVDLAGPDLPYQTVLSCIDCSILDEHDAVCGGLFCRARQWLRSLGPTR